MSGLTLTNYWILIIWIGGAGLMLNFFFKKTPVNVMGRVQYRWAIPAVIILLVPLIIWAGVRPNSIGDTGAYRMMFQDAPSDFSSIGSYLSEIGKDRGFAFLIVLYKTVFKEADTFFFVVIAAVQLICVGFTYRKYSSQFLMSMFLFIASTDYIAWTYNGIRQFIAATVIFACTGLIVKRRYIPAIIIILLVSTIHLSALVMLPFVFFGQGKSWNKGTLLFIVLIILIITYLDRFTGIFESILENTQYADITANELWVNDNGTNIIRVLVYSVPALVSLLGIRYVRQNDDPVINYCINMSIVASGIYVVSAVTSGIYIGRLPIYMSLYSYISLPWLIDHIFEKASGRFIFLLLIILYLVFFYYQIHFSWGIM